MKQLEEIKARASAATAMGEWETTRANDVVIYAPRGYGACKLIAHADSASDAEFIAAARTDVPKLVAALEAVWVLADEHDAECQRIGDLSWVPPGRIRAAIDNALEAT